jgi:glycosyltransferase involved in cell wall biosynthesis
VRAFKEIDRKDLRLVLIGSNEVDVPGEISKLIKGDTRILQLPPSPKVENYYAIADCLVFASEEETMPLVLQEAAYWKIPRITSTYSGHDDLIPNENLAYKFSPKNFLQLSLKMQEFLDEKEGVELMVDLAYTHQMSLLARSDQELDNLIKLVSEFRTSIIPTWWQGE